jgi:SNF2 family DNA or RNA helicase
VCIRRTKNQKINGIPICELPPKHLTEVVLELSKEERDRYDNLSNRAKSIYLNYVKDGTVVKK